MRFQSIALAFALSATVIAHPQRNGDRDGDDDDLNDNDNTPDVGDVDFDDVPVACQDTCNPVVTLTQRCDTNTSMSSPIHSNHKAITTSSILQRK